MAGDLAAGVAALKPPVFVVGYCWGGTAAWLAACRCEGVAAASSFYGRRIPELLAETPRCPIILHFGRRDPSIPPEAVEAIADAHPDMPIHLYDAGHGFASDRRADYGPTPPASPACAPSSSSPCKAAAAARTDRYRTKATPQSGAAGIVSRSHKDREGSEAHEGQLPLRASAFVPSLPS